MFNNTNASLVNNEVINYIHNNRMIHAKVFEILLKNEIQDWIQVHYADDLYPKHVINFIMTVSI